MESGIDWPRLVSTTAGEVEFIRQHILIGMGKGVILSG